jgi:hypothetical protein
MLLNAVKNVVIPTHTTKGYGAAEVKLHSFLKLVLHKDKSRLHAPTALTPGKEPTAPIELGWVDPEAVSEKRLISCSCQESNPRLSIPKHHINLLNRWHLLQNYIYTSQADNSYPIILTLYFYLEFL